MVSVSRFEVILCESDVCFGCVVVFTCDGGLVKQHKTTTQPKTTQIAKVIKFFYGATEWMKATNTNKITKIHFLRRK